MVRGVDVRTGNGSIHLDLATGSNLRSPATVSTGVGSVELGLPQDLRATLEASTGIGSLHCDFTLNNSKMENGTLRGELNGGGSTLRVRSGTGSVSVRRL